METQEFFKNWKSGSPKSFDKFEKYLKKYNLIFETNYNDDIRIIMNFFFIKKPLTDISKWQCLIFEFETIIGILQYFFLENKIDTFIKLRDVLLHESCFFEDGKIFYKNILQNIFLQSAEILEKELG